MGRLIDFLTALGKMCKSPSGSRALRGGRSDSFSSTPALADLVGSDVTATLYYPNLATVYSTAGPVLIGPSGVDFTTLAARGNSQISRQNM